MLACVGFFLPLAGCVLELSSRYPQEGGLYVWTREAFGEFAGFHGRVDLLDEQSSLLRRRALLCRQQPALRHSSRAQHLADANAYYLVFTVGMLALITVLNVLGPEHRQVA